MKTLLIIIIFSSFALSQNREVYYYDQSNSIIIERLDRYPAQSLYATYSGDMVTIKDTITGINELTDHYERLRKKGGDQWATSAANTVDSLNAQFEKGMYFGDGVFTGVNLTVVVLNGRIKRGDRILINPRGSSVSEVLYVDESEIIDGQFTLRRKVLNSLLSLTSGLAFEYIILSR